MVVWNPAALWRSDTGPSGRDVSRGVVADDPAAHLNLNTSLALPKLDRRSRHHPHHGPGRNLEPYREEPKQTNKVAFAGHDPYENEDW